MWRLLRAIIVIVLIILALPYVLVPLYRTGHPASTLMLARWATGRTVGARLGRSEIDLAVPAAHGDGLGGFAFLQPSRHRLGRDAGRDR